MDFPTEICCRAWRHGTRSLRLPRPSALIRDGDTVVVEGFGRAMFRRRTHPGAGEARFLQTGNPAGSHVGVHRGAGKTGRGGARTGCATRACSSGPSGGTGGCRVSSARWPWENKIEAYNLPQGVHRAAIFAIPPRGKPGLLTRVGLDHVCRSSPRRWEDQRTPPPKTGSS